MGILREIREAKRRTSTAPFEVVSVSEIEVKTTVSLTIEEKLKATVVSEFERPMFEYAAKRYLSGSTWMLDYLLTNKSRPLTRKEFDILDKQLWADARMLSNYLTDAAEERYTATEDELPKLGTPVQLRRWSRSNLATVYLSSVHSYGFKNLDIYRALVAWGLRHPELGLSTDLERPLIIKDIIEYRAKLLGIPECFKKAYKNVWRI